MYLITRIAYTNNHKVILATGVCSSAIDFNYLFEDHPIVKNNTINSSTTDKVSILPENTVTGIHMEIKSLKDYTQELLEKVIKL